MRKYRYKILNLDCANCAREIEEYLNKDKYLNNVVVNFNTKKISFESDKEFSLKEINDLVKKIEPDANVTNENEVKQIAEKTYQYFRKIFNTEGFNVLKPMPSPIDKIQNRFRWRIIIKGNMNEQANGVLNDLLKEIYSENYKNTKVSVDVNPNSMV